MNIIVFPINKGRNHFNIKNCEENQYTEGGSNFCSKYSKVYVYCLETTAEMYDPQCDCHSQAPLDNNQIRKW